ncbi:MAG: T9SS type A sorting domain-containing protein [Candidatus Marinimicrobia bacterium]|jgi:hypothetical protein|nr:T9SS type A sorting domain-containing protein [Candidatus Neomarinimicrobiota bacterium]MEE1572978.1 T9SS type A sorting domain-containing protein [Candidatus Neomarinimicrobiota bacterium]HJN68931.1 T9SS type A sorting domain-containing protein [Candidatus Neomarinimicrobiota bacterium]
MKRITVFLMTALVSLSILLPKERPAVNNDKARIMHDGREYAPNRVKQNSMVPTREDIIYSDDFEGDIEWDYDAGWELTESDYNSPSHSFNSPNDAGTQNASWNLLSPVISLPEVGPDDNINFGFHLYTNQVDSDGDGDNFLEDYYSVSMMDPSELAWHASDFNAWANLSYWCGKEDIDGYLDSWLQFLDSPPIAIPSSGYELTTMMAWGIESPEGASVAGTCTDGWDAANVRVSTDGGSTWDLLTGSDPYDFEYGYGWIWNDAEYDCGGDLEHLASGWGDQADWHEVTFNLDSYAGEEVIIRFAFGSDPAYCTPDDATLTGFRVDDILVSNSSGDVLFGDDADGESSMTASGAVWVDQFYDYWDDGSLGGGVRPGSLGWEEYLPGLPFNGNVFLDITEYGGKDVIFRIQSRYDDNDDGGQGLGLFIDDFKIYLPSSASYAPPTGLTGEGLDGSCELQWNDMTASGTEDFIYDNDGFSGYSIYMNSGYGYAGETFEIVGPSVVNTIWIYNSANNTLPTQTEISGYGLFGSLYNTEPIYTEAVSLSQAGWNEISLAGHEWSFDGRYIIAYQISDVVNGELDDTAVPSEHSMFRSSSSAWQTWLESSGSDLSDGEWGIRANITFDGVDATYNVYRDMAQISSGLTVSNYTDTDVMNNVPYTYAVSATYSDGEESALSESVTLTPEAQTVYELVWDDGTSEMGFNAGGGNYTAVRFTAVGNDDLIRIRWYQVGDGGAFYLKMWDDSGGLPGDETYSTIVSGGDDGWNAREMMDEQITLSGTFWVGAKEFSSTNPFGLDTNSDSENSYFQIGTGGWEPIANSGLSGNLMFRASLDHPEGGTISLDVDHMADWNLVGLPVSVEDPNHMSIFPDAIEGTLFSFGNGYELQDDLVSGNGYWLRFTESGSTTITGELLGSVSVSLVTDWNLISGPSDAVSFDNIDDPDGLIIPGTVYGFGNGYELTETLNPGFGYWVRSTGDGSVNIGAARSGKTTTPFAGKLDNANIISFNDAELYFGVDIPEENKLSYSLPPKPPAGSFDIRFTGDWKAVTDFGTIEIMNNSGMIHLHYEIKDQNTWSLINPNTGEEIILVDSGELQIDGNPHEFNLSRKSKEDVPNVFTLNPAFPNPFNPSTQISYFVPKESMIDISVYDISGRLIETLVNELKNYGPHSIMWNASSQASGVYFVRIKTDGFTNAQKVILTK